MPEPQLDRPVSPVAISRVPDSVHTSEIVSVTGRWASLDTGEHVTAIPPFYTVGDGRKFDAMLAEFHAHPADYLNAHGIREAVRGR